MIERPIMSHLFQKLPRIPCRTGCDVYICSPKFKKQKEEPFVAMHKEAAEKKATKKAEKGEKGKAKGGKK